MSVVVDTGASAHVRLRPVPLAAVTLADAFWAPRLQLNREVTLPTQYALLESTGRLENFRRAAAANASAPYHGYFFNDSDVYKWLEAAGWALAAGGDLGLEAMAGEVAALIGAAQAPDGYLDTYFTVDKAPERWTNLRDMHELYCAGHLFQAAVAHARAGSAHAAALMQVARRLADHVCVTFGEGGRPGVPGHPEVEMALVELARTTGEARYLRQAQRFVDARGHGQIGGAEYHQDHRPLREMEALAGHAVRALYLCAGAADLVAESGDRALRAALERLWTRMVTRQMYITGGLGARHAGESFGADYELPNARAYAETCAAIAAVMWNWRMLALQGEARYADALELALYNGVLPGIGLDGRSYFYENPLAVEQARRREAWFACACCPPNVARLLASLPAYFYSTSAEGVWVHQYAQGSAECSLPDGRAVRVEQAGGYPWQGDVLLRVYGEGEFSLFVRVPAWCEAGASVAAPGGARADARPGRYTEIRRRWQPGDSLRLHFPMPPRRVTSHPYVEADAGRAALMRGPLVYCLEGADHPGVDLRQVVLPAAPALWRGTPPGAAPGLPADCVTLPLHGLLAPPAPEWDERLYSSSAAAERPGAGIPVDLTAIPYFAWANREPGPMRVWLRGL